MKTITSTLKSIFVSIAIASAFCVCASADEPEPVQIGSTCTDNESIYHLTTDIEKTLWKFDQLYAVPVGTVNPELWDQSPLFNGEFSDELDNQESAQAYAEACGNVWQDYFTNNADVLVNVSRSITATDQIVQCVSGNWVLLSTEYLELQDVSDWITVSGSPFDVTNESTLQLQSGLQNLIDSLNAQPGASSDPE